MCNGAPNIRYGTSSSSRRKTYFAEKDLALALAFVAQQRIQLDILLGTSASSSHSLAQQQRRRSRRLSNRHGKSNHGGSSDSSSGRQHFEAEDSLTSILSSSSWAQLAASTTAAGVSSNAPRSTDASLSNTAGSEDLGFKDPFEPLPPAPKVEHLLASATAAPRPWIGRLRGTLDGQGHISRTPQSKEHNVYVLRYRPLLHLSKRFYCINTAFGSPKQLPLPCSLLLSTTCPIVPCSRNSNPSIGTKPSNATNGAPWMTSINGLGAQPWPKKCEWNRPGKRRQMICARYVDVEFHKLLVAM